MTDVRSRLAEIDRLRETERGAESLRGTMRLCSMAGRKITSVVRFRYFRRDDDVPLTGGEGRALYDALGIVSRDAAARADELERTLRVEP